MKNLSLWACAVVRVSNMKISRSRLADYVKTFHQKVCCTCRNVIFPHSTNQISDLWCCGGRCRRHFLNSLIAMGRQRKQQRHKLMIWLVEWGRITVLHVQHVWCMTYSGIFSSAKTTLRTARMSSENVTSHFGNHFSIVQSNFARKMCSNYPGIKLEPALQKKRRQNWTFAIMWSRRPHNHKIGHFTSFKERERLRDEQ